MAKRVGRLNAIATANTAPFENGMRRMSRSMQMSSRSAGVAASAMRTFTRTLLPLIGASLSGRAAVRSLMGAFQNLDALAKTSRQLRITINELRGFRLIASEAGVESSTLERGIDALNRRMGRLVRGSATTAEGLSLLGLEADKMLSLTPSERFIEIARAIDRIGVDSDRTTAALEQLFRQSGTSLLNLFRQGADEIERSIGLVNELGGDISAQMAGRIEAANDSMARFRMRMGAARDAIAIGIAPVIDDVSNSLLEWVGAADDFDERVRNTEVSARRILATFTGITAIIRSASASIMGLATSVEELMARVNKSLSLPGTRGRAYFEAIEQQANEANKRHTEAIESARKMFDQAMDMFDEASRQAQSSIDDVAAGPTDDGLESWGDRVIRAATEMRDEFDAITRSLDPTIEKSAEYARMLDVVNEAHENGIISAREFAEAREAIFRDANSDLIRQAEQLEQSLRTPFEQVQDELKDAEHLFDLGFIGQDTLQRAIQHAEEQVKALMGASEDLGDQDPFQEMTDSAKEYEQQLQRVFSLIRGEAISGAQGSIRLGPSTTLAGGFPMLDTPFAGVSGLSGRPEDSPLSAPNMNKKQERDGMDPQAVNMMIDFLSEIARNTREQRAIL
jgi:hypothetical protein